MAEQVLDVEFAGVLLDGPGREGMAKAVGVAAGHVGGASAAAEQLLEAVGLKAHAGPQLAGPGDGPEERARRASADGEVGLERGPAAAGEGDDALLVALAVANQQAAAGEVAVGQVEGAQLGAADAGVEEEEHHGGIAPPDGGSGIARRQQARELGGGGSREFAPLGLGTNTDLFVALPHSSPLLQVRWRRCRRTALYDAVGHEYSVRPMRTGFCHPTAFIGASSAKPWRSR